MYFNPNSTKSSGLRMLENVYNQFWFTLLSESKIKPFTYFRLVLLTSACLTSVIITVIFVPNQNLMGLVYELHILTAISNISAKRILR